MAASSYWKASFLILWEEIFEPASWVGNICIGALERFLNIKWFSIYYIHAEYWQYMEVEGKKKTGQRILHKA